MPEASKARPPGQNQVQKLLKSSPRAPSGTVRRHKRATTFSRQHKPTAKIRCMVYFSCCFQASGSMSGSKVDRTCHCEGIQTNNKCSIPKISSNKHLKITEFFEIPTLAKSARFMVVALEFPTNSDVPFLEFPGSAEVQTPRPPDRQNPRKTWGCLGKVQWQYINHSRIKSKRIQKG